MFNNVERDIWYLKNEFEGRFGSIERKIDEGGGGGNAPVVLDGDSIADDGSVSADVVESLSGYFDGTVYPSTDPVVATYENGTVMMTFSKRGTWQSGGGSVTVLSGEGSLASGTTPSGWAVGQLELTADLPETLPASVLATVTEYEYVDLTMTYASDLGTVTPADAEDALEGLTGYYGSFDMGSEDPETQEYYTRHLIAYAYPVSDTWYLSIWDSDNLMFMTDSSWEFAASVVTPPVIKRYVEFVGLYSETNVLKAKIYEDGTASFGEYGPPTPAPTATVYTLTLGEVPSDECISHVISCYDWGGIGAGNYEFTDPSATSYRYNDGTGNYNADIAAVYLVLNSDTGDYEPSYWVGSYTKLTADPNTWTPTVFFFDADGVYTTAPIK